MTGTKYDFGRRRTADGAAGGNVTNNEGQWMDSPPGPPTKHPIEGDMDRYLTNKASAFRYPPTPDIAAAVRNRLVEETYRGSGRVKGSRHQPVRAWAAMALMVVMVLGALLVVPGVRSFVIDAYGTVVSIFAGDPDKNPPEVPTVTPIEAWNPHLAGETDLGTLISQGMKVMLPQGMPEPDHVYSQFGSEPMILSVWLDRDQAGKPGMALYQFAAHKMELVENLERFVRYRTDIYIGKWKGVWIEGQCKIELAYVEPGGFNRTSSKQLVEGNTLVWFDMEFLQTYVLVGDMSMEEAISIATTVQTPSVIPTPYPTPTPVSHVSRLDLFGETRLSNLSIASGFVPRIPVVEEMPELVAPDRVYLQGSPGLPDSAQVVIMAWLVPKQPDDIRLVLTQGIVDVTVWPDDASGVQTATVNGNGAKWLQAPQKAYVNGPDGKPVQAERSFLTNGYVLVWQEDGLYFRLETTLSLGEAVRLAESLVP